MSAVVFSGEVLRRSVGEHVTTMWRRPGCRGYKLQAASTHLGPGGPAGLGLWQGGSVVVHVVSVAGHRRGAGGRPDDGGMGPHLLAPIFCVGGAVVDASCLVHGLGLSLIGGETKNTSFCVCPMALGSTAWPGEILA
jgi:hypothetical protein